MKSPPDTLEVLIQRAGLRLSAAQVERVREAWALLEPMLERNRGEGLGRFDEPACLFRADDRDATTI